MLFLICLQKIINLRPLPYLTLPNIFCLGNNCFSRIKVHCQSRCRQNLSKVYYKDLTNQRQGYFSPLFPSHTGNNFIPASVVIGRDAIIERDCSAVFVLTVISVSFATYMVETESLKKLLLHSCCSIQELLLLKSLNHQHHQILVSMGLILSDNLQYICLHVEWVRGNGQSLNGVTPKRTVHFHCFKGILHEMDILETAFYSHYWKINLNTKFRSYYQWLFVLYLIRKTIKRDMVIFLLQCNRVFKAECRL